MPADGSGRWEPVEVTARFASRKVIPLYFVAGGRRLDIRHLHYAWTERQGSCLRYHFSVSDAQDQYHLCLDAGSMSWRMLLSG